jgi:hypothetical protein
MPKLSGFILPVYGSVFMEFPFWTGFILSDSPITVRIATLFANPAAFEHSRKGVMA